MYTLLIKDMSLNKSTPQGGGEVRVEDMQFPLPVGAPEGKADIVYRTSSLPALDRRGVGVLLETGKSR